MDWPLTEAKKRLSEVMTLALVKGPQRVHQGKKAIIILSEKAYKKLKGQPPSFVDYLIKGPSFEDLDLTRDQTLTHSPLFLASRGGLL